MIDAWIPKKKKEGLLVVQMHSAISSPVVRTVRGQYNRNTLLSIFLLSNWQNSNEEWGSFTQRDRSETLDKWFSKDKNNTPFPSCLLPLFVCLLSSFENNFYLQENERAGEPHFHKNDQACPDSFSHWGKKEPGNGLFYPVSHLGIKLVGHFRTSPRVLGRGPSLSHIGDHFTLGLRAHYFSRPCFAHLFCVFNERQTHKSPVEQILCRQRAVLCHCSLRYICKT